MHLCSRLRGVAILWLALLAGCAQYTDNRGIEVTWDEAALTDFERGSTTRQDVLDALGPPSQLIATGSGTALYYLYERTRGDGLILVFYNRFDRNTHYDRAIFFFDEQDVLRDFSSRSPGPE